MCIPSFNHGSRVTPQCCARKCLTTHLHYRPTTFLHSTDCHDWQWNKMTKSLRLWSVTCLSDICILYEVRGLIFNEVLSFCWFCDCLHFFHLLLIKWFFDFHRHSRIKRKAYQETDIYIFSKLFIRILYINLLQPFNSVLILLYIHLIWF